MQAKQEPKPYSYHFTKIIPNTAHNTSAGLNQPLSPLNASKNLNINFRYRTEGQQSDKQGLHFKRQSLKGHPVTDKCNEPLKKYTFSLLAHQVRQQRALEIRQSNLSHIQNPPKQLVFDNAGEKLKAEENREKSAVKRPVKSPLNVIPGGSIADELAKEKQSRMVLERQMVMLKSRNDLLEVRIKQIQRHLLQKDNQITQLKANIDQLNKQKMESLALALQNKIEQQCKRLQICSNLCNFNQEDHEQSFEKENKEWSTSTIVYTYDEEYKQILSIFEIEMSEQNYHEKLLAHIERLFKKVEEGARSIAICKEKQKENVRMNHHLRKLEAENIHFINLTAHFGKEHALINEMLQDANRQIQKLSLSALNSKYHCLAAQ